MTMPSVTARWIHGLLWCGVAVPILYYGMQLVAAPFFPGFTIAGTTASELGSPRSGLAALFNTGILVQGGLTLLASAGVWLATRRVSLRLPLRLFAVAVLVLNGVQSLWAGWFPLPDPRHGGHPIFVIGMLLTPLIVALVVWRVEQAWLLRGLCLAAIGLIALMAPVMMGLTGLDLEGWQGLTQRLLTLAVFPPLALVCLALLRATRSLAIGSTHL